MRETLRQCSCAKKGQLCKLVENYEYIIEREAYLRACQTSMMGLFCKNNTFGPWTLACLESERLDSGQLDFGRLDAWTKEILSIF